MSINVVVVQSPPMNISAVKDRGGSSVGIFGAAVFTADVIRALLAYGSYEVWFRRGRITPGDDGVAAWTREGRRTRALDTETIGQLADLDQPVLASEGADLLNHQLIRSTFSSRRDWPITGVIHAIDSRCPPWWLLALAYGQVEAWDALICSSRSGRRVLENHLETLSDVYPSCARVRETPSVQMPLIPLGTDLIEPDAGRRASVRRALQVPDDATLMLYLGRLAPTMKCDFVPLVTAFAAVTRECRARLMIAGDDSKHQMAESIRRFAEELGCGDSVIVRGDPTDAEKLDLYRAADVFVSPSDHVQETFGLTVIEAFAAGLPVIGSDWDGYRDLITDGETGFLLPTYWTDRGRLFDALHLSGTGSDGVLSGATIVDVDALRAAMTVLATNSQLRRRMSETARRTCVERFQWPVVIRTYEALWNELRAQARRDARPARSDGRQCAVERTFGHYPTSTLSDACRVEMGSVAASFDHLLAVDASMRLKSLPSYADVAHSVRHELSGAPGQTLGELVAAACAAGKAGELTVRLVLARMLKHGLLRPLVPRPHFESVIPETADASCQ